MAQSWIRAGLAGAMMLGLAACGGGGETPAPEETAQLETPDDAAPAPPPVKTPQPETLETPEPADPANRPGLTRRAPCGGSETCEMLGEVSVGHGAPGVQIYFDPERDDAIVQWSRTLSGVIDCVESGDDLGACVAASDAAEMCKTEFVRLADAADDRAAFEAVFLTPGSPCRPAEEVQP